MGHDSPSIHSPKPSTTTPNRASPGHYYSNSHNNSNPYNLHYHGDSGLHINTYPISNKYNYHNYDRNCHHYHDFNNNKDEYANPNLHRNHDNNQNGSNYNNHYNHIHSNSYADIHGDINKVDNGNNNKYSIPRRLHLSVYSTMCTFCMGLLYLPP
jgi:hypothetical protein